jgi:hypothetical protein
LPEFGNRINDGLKKVSSLFPWVAVNASGGADWLAKAFATVNPLPKLGSVHQVFHGVNCEKQKLDRVASQKAGISFVRYATKLWVVNGLPFESLPTLLNT